MIMFLMKKEGMSFLLSFMRFPRRQLEIAQPQLKGKIEKQEKGRLCEGNHWCPRVFK